jgi:hypothetical protein
MEMRNVYNILVGKPEWENHLVYLDVDANSSETKSARDYVVKCRTIP